MELGFARALARLRFQHRATELPDGGLAYRLKPSAQHVRVTRGEWQDIGQVFEESNRASARKATNLLLLCLPAYVAYVALCNLVVPKDVARALPQWLYLLVFVGPLPGMPVAVYLWHSRQVQTVSRAIDATLAERPRIPAPKAAARPRPPFWFDLICLLVVGPHVFVALLGELNPDLFRNTPFSGRHLDPKAMAALALIAIRLLWGQWAKAGEPPSSPALRLGRR
jgi:hypothetical protein